MGEWVPRLPPAEGSGGRHPTRSCEGAALRVGLWSSPVPALSAGNQYGMCRLVQCVSPSAGCRKVKMYIWEENWARKPCTPALRQHVALHWTPAGDCCLPCFVDISVQDGSEIGQVGPSPQEVPLMTGQPGPGHGKKLGHRGVDASGETTYKKTTSSTLKGAIQLGIGYTVGNLSSKPERDVLMQDFYVVESIFFPSEGSNLTPAHHFQDFRFKTYAPVAFRYFRELFGIRPDDYLYSLCNEPLIELSNPGASGSLFYVTSDDEFIIKTVMHKEAEFLQKLLPGYYMNLNQNPRTLLPKFYGLYCVQSGGKNIRVVVMNNVLPRVVKMHLKFDLKGSTYKRRASKKEKEKSIPTYKDLDFIQDMPEGLMLDADTFSALVKTLQRDCLVLESFKIMDYSLLLGVHNIDQQERERQAEGAQSTADEKRPLGQKALYSTAMESIQGGAARGEAIETDDTMGGIPAVNGRGERLLLHIGIIDILQSYRFIKKLEHTWKALVHDGDTVSVHRPSFYAERFFKFMSNTVFRKNSSLKSSPSKKGRGALLAVKPLGPTAAFSASQIPSEREDAQYDLRGARSYPTLEDEGRPDLLPCTPPSFEEATTASIATTLSSTSLSIPERSPSESSEQPRYRRETEAQLPFASRPQEETHAEEDLQQITVQVEPACSVEIVVPKEEDAGEGVSPACASAAVEAETASQASEPASQASEPASQASDEEDAPATDIYFTFTLTFDPQPCPCLVLGLGAVWVSLAALLTSLLRNSPLLSVPTPTLPGLQGTERPLCPLPHPTGLIFPVLWICV
ncbi:hypothetical protein E5288_WYG002533 [Bos mutus]|uniref:PIPK domain-containing protein n=1 Tax=Bos mutus TaxID=72004 RepID=A0A6B0R3I1_9CETA|nr:hypothetical protein [Bos mutus]